VSEEQLRIELDQAYETIRVLQAEMAQTDLGVLALVLELEQKLDDRLVMLREAQEEIRRTNSELLQLTLELDDRVIERTEALQKKEEHLRETHQMLAAIIHASPLAMDAVDLQGQVILWSPSAERLFGWKAEEVIGKALPIIPAGLEDDFNQQIADGIQGVTRTGVEIQRQHKDGTRVAVSQSTAPLFNAQGQISGVMAILVDVTERNQIEAELAEVQHQLLNSVETERRELAQDLHDGPMQDLYGISFALRGLDANSMAGGELAAVEEARRNLQQVIDRLRELCGELRPPTLAHFGLRKTILSHIEQFQEKHPEIQIEVDLEGEGVVLAEPLSLGLFRIYQQAMVNVARHAQASHLSIRLAKENSGLVLEIRDDGKGFDVAKRWIEMVREGHLGLVGASERAQALGGHLEIISAPGRGTLLRTIIPDQPTQLGIDRSWR
jgi:PAS domain S-box-containing protein